ncbi:MAG: DUF3857 and transglutaminase domain-containing protein [Mucilaginibacter sp.]|nr:DUF3857 and transglutaminase domain-containing protein [Mucilaginibacter sp.]
MKRSILTIIVAAGFVPAALAQQNIVRETWADKPALHTIDTKYNKESAVILFEKRRVEYIDDAKGAVEQYYTLHKLIHVNDDRGIENFNKIYLGFNEKADALDIKARAILPGGKIIELDKNNIKDLKDEDGYTYKIFALDGLTKGCEVEYFYTFKRPTSFFGREQLQSAFPIQKTVFQLIRPARLTFDVKAYNGEVKLTDTLAGTDKKMVECISENVPGADDEKYSFYNANLKRLEYKLSYNNTQQGGARLFTWNELAKRIYSNYTAYSDRDLKKVQDLIKANGWDKLLDETKKITAVESYLKKNYAFNDDLKDSEPNSLGNVIQNKAGGTEGITRLYGAIYKALGVSYQFVLTGDRTKVPVDKGLENWNNCDNALLYFPNQGK